MLFILTGTIQTGKTRWLMRLIDRLQQDGIESYGVLAPGLWVEATGADGQPSFDKRGFDNLLLPSRTTIPFARRQDLALAEGLADPTSQSSRANLGWEISEEAITQVNRHFDSLASMQQTAKAGLLVIDELGPLELVRGGGLSSALAVAEAGPTRLYEHAIIVVREALLEEAKRRFAPTWANIAAIAPCEEAEDAVRQAYRARP